MAASERFHLPLARKRDHPFDLARLNIVMRSIVEWGESVRRADIAEWASSTTEAGDQLVQPDMGRSIVNQVRHA